jgi:hypothetical protein
MLLLLHLVAAARVMEKARPRNHAPASLFHNNRGRPAVAVHLNRRL